MTLLIWSKGGSGHKAYSPAPREVMYVKIGKIEVFTRVDKAGRDTIVVKGKDAGRILNRIANEYGEIYIDNTELKSRKYNGTIIAPTEENTYELIPAHNKKINVEKLVEKIYKAMEDIKKTEGRKITIEGTKHKLKAKKTVYNSAIAYKLYIDKNDKTLDNAVDYVKHTINRDSSTKLHIQYDKQTDKNYVYLLYKYDYFYEDVTKDELNEVIQKIKERIEEIETPEEYEFCF